MISEFRPGSESSDEFRSLAPAALQREVVLPSATCLLLTERNVPVARCSLEVVEQPEGTRIGVLGHYEARRPDAGERLLRHACARAVEMAAGQVIGPMNGSTWGRYRLVLPTGTPSPPARPFLSEPGNPADYPLHFEAAGFRIAAHYETRIVPRLPVERPRAARLAQRIRSSGISVTASDPERFDLEIEALYHFCSRVFAGNAYYRPIPFERFRQGYAAVQPWLDPRLVLFARDARGGMVGFCLAFPDRLGSTDEDRRLVLKTLASAPESGALGIGAHLADQLHQLAADCGYTAVVHALMHVDNDSVKLSHRFGSRPFRQYALYAWTP